MNNQNENNVNHDWRKDFSIFFYYSDIQREIPDVYYDSDLRSAYELGQRVRSESVNERFEDSESNLKVKWEEFKADSRLKWEHAKLAIKDAWDKI